MKLEALLVLNALFIALGFVLTRNAFLMGALVFVATPLFLVACIFYLQRVVRDLRDKDVL